MMASIKHFDKNSWKRIHAKKLRYDYPNSKINPQNWIAWGTVKFFTEHFLNLWISQIYQFAVFKLFVSSTWKSHQNFLNNILNMAGHFISVWILRRWYYRQTKHSVFLTLVQLDTNWAVACVAANVVPLSLLFMLCQNRSYFQATLVHWI